LGTLARIALFAVGLAIVLRVGYSAIATFAVPTGRTDWLTRVVLRVFRPLLRGVAHDRLRGLFAPLILLVLPVVWLSLVLVGYMAMFRAVENETLRSGFVTSGSSLFTLGFTGPADLPSVALAFTEAAVGLGLVALLISFLPTIYGAYARREAGVALLCVRAGSPPDAVALLRSTRGRSGRGLAPVWARFEEWFADVAESHTSTGVLVWFHSPDPSRSWLLAARAVLEGAAFIEAAVDGGQETDAGACVDAGADCLTRLVAFHRIHREAAPVIGLPPRFDELWTRLSEQDVPLVSDREAAAARFAELRGSFEPDLLALGALVGTTQVLS